MKAEGLPGFRLNFRELNPYVVDVLSLGVVAVIEAEDNCITECRILIILNNLGV